MRGVYAELVEAIAEAEAQLAADAERERQRAERERQRAERKRAKSQPLVVGDRVRAVEYGPGTVTVIEPPWGNDDVVAYYRVRFDRYDTGTSGTPYENSRSVHRVGLERLISGDEGYEPPAMPMIEHKSTLPMEPITLTDRETC